MTVPINPDPFPFLWLVEKQGYEWVRGLDSESRLVSGTSGGPEGRPRAYAPLKDQRLFLRFAALKNNRAEIRKFADRYGVLFDSYGVADMVRRPAGQYSISQLNGTSFHRWKCEIERMRVLVGIWKAVKGGRRRELKKMIYWKDDNSVGYELGGASTWLATPDLNRFLLSRFRPDDVLKPALYVLQREINKQISDETSPTHFAIVPTLVWCPGPQVNDFANRTTIRD